MASGVTTTPERVSSFEASVWDAFFIQYEPDPLPVSEECMHVKAAILKEDARLLFKTFNSTLLEKMTLVDTLERLGIDHLFEEHINTVINKIHQSELNSSGLNEVALCFRLLREHGVWVSPDVFNKFKDGDGSFNKDITNEPRALLSLYNAAYLSIHGESELDEAISFARHHLESMGDNIKYPLLEQVKRNLEIPYPRTLKRIDAPYYIAEYGQEKTCNPSLLELAKLNFNLLQCVHQRELKGFCRWGNDLYEEVELSYSRNRIVECYFWSYTVHFEQEYGHARIILAKVFVLTSMLDDTFDMHATLEEAEKLTKAIQRWDESAVFLLPEYLKKFYVRLMNTFIEIEDQLKPDHKYRVSYCRKAIQSLCRSYQQESEWFHNSYIPSFEDHLKCSLISSAIAMLSVVLLVGMGDEATTEAFEWAIGCTDAVMAGSVVARLVNDMTSFKHGKNKKDVASSVDSYINQYHVTGDVAFAVLDNMVEDAWKTTNQTRFDRRAMLPLVERVARMTKSMVFTYHHKKDRYTFSHLNKDRVKQQFVDPIPL